MMTKALRCLSLQQGAGHMFWGYTLNGQECYFLHKDDIL